MQNMHIFPQEKSGNRTFIDQPGKLREHSTTRFTDHLNSERHKTSVQKKQN